MEYTKFSPKSKFCFLKMKFLPNDVVVAVTTLWRFQYTTVGAHPVYIHVFVGGTGHKATAIILIWSPKIFQKLIQRLE